MQHQVTIYTTTLCPVCRMVKEFFDMNDIPYKEINVDFHPIELMKLIGKTGKLSVPQTNINGKWLSGFDPVQILKELQN